MEGANGSMMGQLYLRATPTILTRRVAHADNREATLPGPRSGRRSLGLQLPPAHNVGLCPPEGRQGSDDAT